MIRRAKEKVTKAVVKKHKELHLRKVSWLEATKALLLILVAAAFIYRSANFVKYKYIKHVLRNSVVKLTNFKGNSGGTGFNIELGDRNLVVTNAHVCRIGAATNTLRAVTSDGTERIVKIVSISPDYDLCVVEGTSNSGNLPSLSSRPANLSDPVYVGGHPELNPLVLSSGDVIGQGIIPIGEMLPPDEESCRVGTIQQETIFFTICITLEELVLTNAVIYPGSSGSPVLNVDGEIVGVMNSGSNSTHFGNYVPLHNLVKFLNNVPKQ